MLNRLEIKNMALIESASIDFSNGINDFPKAFITRLPQALIMAVVEFVVLVVVFSKKSKIRILLEKNIKRFI